MLSRETWCHLSWEVARPTMLFPIILNAPSVLQGISYVGAKPLKPNFVDWIGEKVAAKLGLAQTDQLWITNTQCLRYQFFCFAFTVAGMGNWCLIGLLQSQFVVCSSPSFCAKHVLIGVKASLRLPTKGANVLFGKHLHATSGTCTRVWPVSIYTDSSSAAFPIGMFLSQELSFGPLHAKICSTMECSLLLPKKTQLINGESNPGLCHDKQEYFPLTKQICVCSIGINQTPSSLLCFE